MGRGPGVRPTSATSIQIDFTYRGRRYRERISLPPKPANIRYAKSLKATIDHEIATHTFDYAKHFPNSPRARALKTAGTPLSVALPAYIDGLAAELEPETITKYRYDAALIVAGLPPNETLSTLTRAKVRDWAATNHLSKKRLDNLLIPLRGALRQAVDDGLIPANPLAGFQVRRAKKPGGSIDPFTPAELGLLAGQSLGAVWVFWAWTGMRSGELIALRWGDIGAGTVSITKSVRVGREKAPKTERGVRVLALLPEARRALGRLTRAEPDTAVFLNPNTQAAWHEDRGLARAFRKDCKAAGVRYRYPYQLRHTFATWALSSGENPAWIARYLGHADSMMLFKVYGKWMPSLDPKAGSKMAKAAGTKAA